MICKHLHNNHCTLVEKLTSLPCPVTTECSSCSQDINLVTLTLAATSEKRHGKPPTQYDISLLGHGYGTRLHNLLGRIGIHSTPSLSEDREEYPSSLSEVGGCDCNTHKDILDLWTPEYIRKNIDQVVGWLSTEARRRRLPFSYTLTRFLLLRLISK